MLLAPGSPKVIDFGIARAVDGDQRGTPAPTSWSARSPYMAPERFGSRRRRGAHPGRGHLRLGRRGRVRGHRPHAVRRPTRRARWRDRILTEPPDLDGLTGPLRELIEHALAKDPADRPTARELLDRLLSPEPRSSQDLASALARQPALRIAAEQAQAVAEPTTVAAPAPPSTVERPASAARWSRLAITALALAVLVVAVTVSAVVFDLVPSSRNTAASPSRATTPSSPPPGTATTSVPPSPTATTPLTQAPSGQPGPSVPPGATMVISDRLGIARLWHIRQDEPNKTTCTFRRSLIVTKLSVGPYRCPGPQDQQSDLSAFVNVQLLTAGSCASVWFRYTDASGGYALRVCQDGYYLAAHAVGDANPVTPLHQFPVDSPISIGVSIRVGVQAVGDTLTFYRDGRQIGVWQDATFVRGRVVLGIFTETTDEAPPFSVAFANIAVWAPTA